MMELNSHPGPVQMDGLSQLPKAFDKHIVVEDEAVIPSPASRGVDARRFHDDEADTAPCDRLIMIDAPLGDEAAFRTVISDHRRANEPILQLHPADSYRFKNFQGFHSLVGLLLTPLFRRGRCEWPRCGTGVCTNSSPMRSMAIAFLS